MTKLRGVGWNHVRCMGPLQASVDEYKHRAAVDVTWDTRSLSHFGEGDLSELLDYDLVIFDHPYSGQIAKEGWFVDLTKILTASAQTALAADSLGACWASYHADGGVWGLPIDAAAQTASCRPDLMTKLAREIPRSFEEVMALGRHARNSGVHVGFPAFPIDAICTFLTLCANNGIPVARDKSYFPSFGETVEVLDSMKALLEIAHPQSVNWNPIRAYDHMSTADDVCYIPYAFSYTNYSRKYQAKPIKFCDIPGYKGTDCSGALLGGAGIGISSHSRHIDEAVDYARYLCSPEYQAGAYFHNEGQPASLAAWTTEENDDECMDFFSGTLETMRNSYIRPTFDGYIDHFRNAGPRIRGFLQGDGSAKALADWLKADYFQ